MKIIKNDDSVRPLNEKQWIVLNRIFNHYADVMIEQVMLFETGRGHVVQLQKQGGRFAPHEKGMAGRFDLEDLQVLTHPGIRWIEFSTDMLKVAL